QGRARVAALLGAEPDEIVFTSGATEAINLALKGVFEAWQVKGRHFITVKTEHKAVLDTCRRIRKWGGEVTLLDVRPDGLVDLDRLEAAIRPDTVMVAVMWANNETGVIQPIAEIGAICARHDVLFFSDATQAVGKIPVQPKAAGVHLLACSAHKMYGPKGVGALYVTRQPRIRLAPLIDGGGHERGLRSGTLNVPGIVGFGQAAAIALAERDAEAARLQQLRDRLEAGLTQLPEVYVNGAGAPRLPHVSNLMFRYVDAEAMLMSFNRYVAVSTGSACTSATLEPSHVLRAMGLSDDDAHASIRFSLGRFNTADEVEYVIEAVSEGVAQFRAESPMWQMFQ
ncbi:MAG: aminotransferase class V-fold PLP-dependent enzyme, partial [Bacteroidetes bacterium]